MLEIKSDTVEHNDAQQLLKSFIDAGGYSPGDRLPSERELISNLGITRSVLRKGLDALERDGTIWRHVGKGTFITSLDSTNSIAGVEKISLEISPIQMMRARLTLEPSIAREAAVNASTESVRKIVNAGQEAISATTWNSYEASDDAFHRTIAQATGNVFLNAE